MGPKPKHAVIVSYSLRYRCWKPNVGKVREIDLMREESRLSVNLSYSRVAIVVVNASLEPVLVTWPQPEYAV